MQSNLKPSTKERVKEWLEENVRFPSSPQAYEFPDLERPKHYPDPCWETSRAAGVKGVISYQKAWGSPRPDFLVTGLLEKSLVSLQEVIWDPDSDVLSRCGDTAGQNKLEFKGDVPSITCIFGARGSGKTRYVFERCAREFGICIMSEPDIDSSYVCCHGLDNIIGSYARDVSLEELQKNREEVVQKLMLIVFVFVTVLEAANKACGGAMMPHHWLALQLNPHVEVRTFTREFRQGNVFRKLYNFMRDLPMLVSRDEMLEAYAKSAVRFIAVDDASDLMLRRENFEWQMPDSRSYGLSLLLKALFEFSTHVLLVGSSVRVFKVCRAAVSDSPTERGLVQRWFCVTTHLGSEDVANFVKASGATAQLDSTVARDIAGRPFFAVYFAEGLMYGMDYDVLRKRVSMTISYWEDSRTYHHYSEYEKVRLHLRCAVQSFALRCRAATISRFGQTALERGLATIRFNGGIHPEYVVQEKVLLKVDYVRPYFIDGITVGDSKLMKSLLDWETGRRRSLFEERLAIIAEDLFDTLRATRLEKIERGLEFIGPWFVQKPTRDNLERYAIQCNDGQEPAAIEMLLSTPSEGRAPTVVFPGPAMGATIVTVAQSKGRRLLLFIHANPSPHASGEVAMQRLTHPYHTNSFSEVTGVSSSSPSGEGGPSFGVPTRFKIAYEHLCRIIESPAICVVFMVIVTAVKVKPRIGGKLHVHKFGKDKAVLHSYIDRSNAARVLSWHARDMLVGFARAEHGRAHTDDDVE